MANKKHILLVDDDVNLLTTLGDLLESEGYCVATAESGEVGLEALQTAIPDLIILDMNMPGMGGLGFLRALSDRKMAPRPPVYVFTARANFEEFFEGLDVVGFMAKPCEPDALLAEVARVLASAKPPPDTEPAAAPCVLIAEDDAGDIRRIARAFERAGYTVEKVENGPDALAKAISCKPDVLLAKKVLTGMNGDKLATMLRQMEGTAAIPVVVYEETAATQTAPAPPPPAVARVVQGAKSDDLLTAVAAVLSG